MWKRILRAYAVMLAIAVVIFLLFVSTISRSTARAGALLCGVSLEASYTLNDGTVRIESACSKIVGSAGETLGYYYKLTVVNDSATEKTTHFP